MKNTPERLKAMDNIVMAVKYFNEHISETGYQIERHISADNEYIYLRIKTPRDDKYAAYPEVYINGRILVRRVFQLHHAQRQAVDEQKDIRPAVDRLAIIGVFYGKLIDRPEDIVLRFIEVDQRHHPRQSGLRDKLDAVHHPVIHLM